MPDIVNALEAATIATMSAFVSVSWDSTVKITCVSFLKPSGNSGLIGLSINLHINVSASVGLASLLKKPPGIFPAA